MDGFSRRAAENRIDDWNLCLDPDVRFEGLYHFNSDLYSLGRILLKVLQLPFDSRIWRQRLNPELLPLVSRLLEPPSKRLSFSEFYQQVDIIGFHATMEMTAMDFNSETTAAEYLEPQAIKTFERPTQQQTEFDAAMDAAMAAMDFTSTTPDDFEPQAIEGAAFNKRQEPDNDEENDRAFYAAIKDAMQFMDLSQETDDLNPIDLGKA